MLSPTKGTLRARLAEGSSERFGEGKVQRWLCMSTAASSAGLVSSYSGPCVWPQILHRAHSAGESVTAKRPFSLRPKVANYECQEAVPSDWRTRRRKFK